jgi:hypothetical protein
VEVPQVRSKILRVDEVSIFVHAFSLDVKEPNGYCCYCLDSTIALTCLKHQDQSRVPVLRVVVAFFLALLLKIQKEVFQSSVLPQAYSPHAALQLLLHCRTNYLASMALQMLNPYPFVIVSHRRHNRRIHRRQRMAEASVGAFKLT